MHLAYTLTDVRALSHNSVNGSSSGYELNRDENIPYEWIYCSVPAPYLLAAVPTGLDEGEMRHRRLVNFDELKYEPRRIGSNPKALHIRVLDDRARLHATKKGKSFSRARLWGFAGERVNLSTLTNVKILQEQILLGVDSHPLTIVPIYKLQKQYKSTPSPYPVSSLTDYRRTIRITGQDNMSPTELPSRSSDSSPEKAGLGTAGCLVPESRFGIVTIAVRVISNYFISNKYEGLRMRLHNQ